MTAGSGLWLRVGEEAFGRPCDDLRHAKSAARSFTPALPMSAHLAAIAAHGLAMPGVVLILHGADAIVRTGGRPILPLPLQESGEVVRAEPGVQEHLTIVFGDPAPQLGVDRDLALTRLRQVEAGKWCIIGVME